jgi:hypothetical protein
MGQVAKCVYLFCYFVRLYQLRRSQWPHGLRHEMSSSSRTLGSWARIPLKAWMSVFILWPLWSSGQSSWLQIQRSRVRFPALLDFLRSSGSGTGSTQPREDN